MSASPSSSDRFPQLEKYELCEEIGHGGMATVYRARDARLGREVAVKVIHKHLRENPEVRRRFVAEARAVAKLRHPGIVDVYDVSDEADLERYLVVELIRGASLRQTLQKQGVLPAEIAAIMVSQLCDAVEHAHHSGVIHRDIKPENVMIEVPQRAEGERVSGTSEPPRVSSERHRKEVRIKLTDFGIAKVLDAQGVTSTGQILGSPAHMAPEQIEGGEIGPATDVFALGVLFYECMVGHLPFEGKNPAQVLRRVLEGQFEPADVERPEVGGRWAAIVAGALATDVAERTHSASELSAQIDAELLALGIDDPRGELLRFFADPEAYRSSLRHHLVPRLLERGEQERRSGRVPLAAADFNRALALRPDDLAILKRVSTLSAHTVWRERATRGAMVALGSLVLGGGAYGVTRWVKAASLESAATQSVAEPAPAPSVAPAAPVAPVPSPPPIAALPSEANAEPATTAETGPNPAPRPTGVAVGDKNDDKAEKKTTRQVKFHLNPGGAKLAVDGAVVSDWWTPRELGVGGHQARAWSEDGCCEETSQGFVVESPPSDNPEAIQTVTVFLEVKPARFRLAGGPPGGMVICHGASATASSTGEIALGRTIEWSGSCVFTDGSGQQLSAPVKLRAGETRTLPWPQGS